MKSFKFKKADLSINMVIVAAIAILVLIVMVMVFSGKMSVFGNTIQDCGSQGGFCSRTTPSGEISDLGMLELKKLCEEDNYNDFVVIKNTNCDKQDQICCKRILGGQS